MIQAVVFDFDGVLVESTEIKTDAFRSLFSDWPDFLDSIIQYHLAHQGVSRYDKFRHIYRHILKRPLSPNEEIELGKRFQALVLERVVRAPWVPGALPCLEWCLGRSPLYLASGTPQEELEMIIHQRAMERYFVAVYGSPRHKVDILKEIVLRLGAEPPAVVFVGDSRTDYESAKAVGVRFVLRIKGSADGVMLGEGIPTITKLTELASYLESLDGSFGVCKR